MKTARTSPRDYLDKIFHLTYTMPPMSAAGAANLLSSPPPPRTAAPAQTNTPPPQESIAAAVPSRPSVRIAEALQLTPIDDDALRRVAPLVSTSPRRVNRFHSAYLVVRARALGDPQEGNHLRGAGHREAVESLATLVALIFGVPETAHALLDPNLRNSELSLREWLADDSSTGHEGERHRIAAFLAQADSLATLPMTALMRWLPITLPFTSFALPEEVD
jgi:hypothetical protein